MPDWSAARAAMLLDPGVVNLNTGSFGPTPRAVFERATALRRRLAEEPMDFLLRQAPPLLFFSHVLAATGMVLPAAELCDLARKHGVLSVVDGAHAPAMVDVHIDALGCDFYGGNCHKWLLAPIGSGFLALGRNSIDRLQPLSVSWGYYPDRGRQPDERDEFGSTPRLRQLEFEGTRDACAWLAVPDAI